MKPSRSFHRFSRYLLTPIVPMIVVLSLVQSCSEPVHLEPLDENAVILALGDSLTYGMGAGLDQSYPAVLEKLIKRKVINAGVSGEVTASGLKRLPGLLTSVKPDLVILCHGANDILRKFPRHQTKQNLQKMIDLILEHDAQALLLAVPDFNLFLSPADLYLDLAKDNKIIVLEDTLSGILLNNQMKSDHVHPNAKGYRKIAASVAELLHESGAL